MFHQTKATLDKNEKASLYMRFLRPEILCGGIALCMMALLILYAGKKSFFSDEVDQLGILVSSGSLRDLLSVYAGMGHEVAPPLFAIVAYLWYCLVPFTQKWLLALPAIVAGMGIYVTGMSGKLLGGRRVAVLSALFACALPAMATTIGVQFRQYAFVFLFASLTVYAYLRRLQRRGQERVTDILLYGIVMAGLPYSHYLSVFVCFYLFAVDLILLIRKEIRPICLLSYGIGALLFAPWGITILSSAMRISSFWIPIPRIIDIRDALYFLTDALSVRFILYIGGVCSAALAIWHWQEPGGERNTADRIVALAFAVAAPVMILVLYLYSRYLSDGIALFLPRYFLCTLPMVILTATVFTVRLFDLLVTQHIPNRRRMIATFMTVCAVICGLSAWQNVQDHASEILEPYRESIDYLCEQPDIYNEDVAVITGGESQYVTAGLEALYITRNGTRPAFAVFDRVRPFTEADVSRYYKVYVMEIHASMGPESEQTLLEHYQRLLPENESMQWNISYYTRIES